ncbi:Sulfatase-modifying factor enzyme [Gracilaria domingensis]|nr:Sulfatase-modifying factor enzyme [Gracilaria domingensis]
MAQGINPILAAQIRKDLQYVWDVGDNLFQSLKEAGLLLSRPISLRHPFIFYALHLSAFSVRLINLAKPGFINGHGFDELYDRGIDPPADENATPVEITFPTWQEIQEYQSHCRRGVLDVLKLQVISIHLLHALRLVVEHDLMHHETLRYMMGQTHLTKFYDLPDSSDSVDSVESGRVRVQSGIVIPGVKKTNGYHARLDNEYDLRRRDVDSFVIGKYAVTNAEFLDFMKAGGYSQRDFWGRYWKWIQDMEISMPASWRKRESTYQVSYIPTDNDDETSISQRPVLVSVAEAEAYAKWKGGRLPTEEEWVRATVNRDEEPQYDRGWQPVQKGSIAWSGVVGLCGNGWEITSSMFQPFEGFEPSHLYPGYSADFYDGNHHVLKGASPHTDPLLFRSSFRNFFQPCYRFVLAKFRVVWNDSDKGS